MSPFGDCTADSYSACLSRPAYPAGSAGSMPPLMMHCNVIHRQNGSGHCNTNCTWPFD